MKTYKIFLASSSELKADRLAFETFIGRENKRLNDKNVFLQLEIWEDAGDGMSRTRSQDEYDRLLIECDLFVMLYWKKVGKYTNEEYDLARAQFLSTPKPKKIYTYRKTIFPPVEPNEADKESLREFEQKLSGIELFPINYDSAEALKLDFGTKLKDLFDDGTLVYGGMAKCLSAGQPAVPEGFIGRRDELETIRQKMNKGGTLMLINSEGGMGKTSIAAKYWTENLYQYTHNAWLFCENGIVEEMKKLAPELNLDLTQLPESQHVAALRTRLQNLPADCLLVLDNANDPEDIKAFRRDFSGLHWHVLLTSRCQRVLNPQQELHITNLLPTLAKELFTSYYNEQTPEFENLLDRLLVAIGYNTLLIELFAKNMAELAAMGETMTMFLKRIEETLFLRDWSFEVTTPYTTHIHKEAATTDAIIDVLYDLTKLTEPERFRLVNMAFLPAESHLLTTLIDLFVPYDKIALRNQLAGLAQKGWLTTDTRSYRLSPVIQKIVLAKNRNTLWADGKGLAERLTDLLKIDQDKDNVTTRFKWIVYAQYLYYYAEESEELISPDFRNRLAFVLMNIGGRNNLLQAKTLLEKAIENCRIASDIIIYQTNLALVLCELSGEINLKRAKILLEQALENHIADFGESSPDVARGRSNLAVVLKALGGKDNLIKARILLEKALESDIVNWGNNAPIVANRQSNLAGVLQDLDGENNLQKAKVLLTMALDNAIVNYEKANPVTTNRQSNLAVVLLNLGGRDNLMQAQALLRKALTSNINNFGKTAPIVTKDQSNLAVVLQKLDGESNLQEAQSLLENALISDIDNFGETDPTVASDQSNLALVLRDLGGKSNLERAKDLMEKAISCNINSFGENAYIVAIHQSNLAGILWTLGGPGNMQTAKTLSNKALNTTVINFGNNHPKVAEVQSDLAAILFELGERKFACQLLLQAYWIFRRSFNEEYEYTQAALNLLRSNCPECFEKK